MRALSSCQSCGRPPFVLVWVTVWREYIPCQSGPYSQLAYPSLIFLCVVDLSPFATLPISPCLWSQIRLECSSHDELLASPFRPSWVSPWPQNPPAWASDTLLCVRCRLCSSPSTGAKSCCPQGLRFPWSSAQIGGSHLLSPATTYVFLRTKYLSPALTDVGAAAILTSLIANPIALIYCISIPNFYQCLDVSKPYFQLTFKPHRHFHGT